MGMVENVTDIIVARSREPEGLKTMIVCSIGGHIVLAVVALLWGGLALDTEPRTVMTISLSGVEGPKTGGLTPIGGQSVQAPLPEPQPKPVEAPPAEKPPAMTLPNPRSRPRPGPTPQQAPLDATAKTLSTGETPREGSTRVRGQGFNEGLGSAGGNGAAVTLDVVDFCCNEYVDQMVAIVRRSWDQNHGVVGSTTMQFTILRNGVIDSPKVEKSSGFVVLDNAALRALQLTRLPPLPAAFENPTLTVHLRFDYQR
jgi:TonB family protein